MPRQTKFYHKISRHIQTNQAQAHNISRSKNLAKRSKHEILAPTTELRGVLRDAGLWHFSRNLWQRLLSNTATKDLFPIPRVFHSQANFVRDGWNPEHERSAGRPNFQYIGQPLWRCFIQKDMQHDEFRMNSSNDFRLTRRKKKRFRMRLRLCNKSWCNENRKF